MNQQSSLLNVKRFLHYKILQSFTFLGSFNTLTFKILRFFHLYSKERLHIKNRIFSAPEKKTKTHKRTSTKLTSDQRLSTDFQIHTHSSTWKVFLQHIIYIISIFNIRCLGLISRNFYEIPPFEVPARAWDNWFSMFLLWKIANQ